VPVRRALATAAAAGLLAAATAATAACGSSAAGSGGRLAVVTTVAPLTNIAAVVGGDRVSVTGLVPEGQNSHTFEPPPSAAEVISRADLILVNGLKLEDPTAELAEENKAGDAAVVAVGDRVLAPADYIYDFSFPKKDGKPNPHLWTDPLLAIRYAEVIRDEYAKRDPDGKATYDANLAAFAKAATALSDAVRAASASIPAERRGLLTYHDGFAYFARDYGWKVIGAIQPANFEEPSPREVAALIDQIRREKVPAIFGSEVFPSTVLAQIGRSTGARYVDTLRDDDLPGRPGDPGHSWWGLMRADFTTMVTGLGGDAGALAALADPALPDTARYPQ
jgi:ABC-type Zn uptake system ZnuABC Zn-binding protein ZnuA